MNIPNSVVSWASGILGALLGFIGIRLHKKVDALEAERSSLASVIAVLTATTAQSIGTLATAIERNMDQTMMLHSENKAQRERERDATVNWRENIFAPLIQKVAIDMQQSKDRLDSLEDLAPPSTQRGRIRQRQRQQRRKRNQQV